MRKNSKPRAQISGWCGSSRIFPGYSNISRGIFRYLIDAREGDRWSPEASCESTSRETSPSRVRDFSRREGGNVANTVSYLTTGEKNALSPRARETGGRSTHRYLPKYSQDHDNGDCFQLGERRARNTELDKRIIARFTLTKRQREFRMSEEITRRRACFLPLGRTAAFQ